MRKWLGEIDESSEGVELHRLITQHWHMGTMDGLEINEFVAAAKTLGVSVDELFNGMDAANRERGVYEAHNESVMQSGFVPTENVARVRELLDEIQSLCLHL